MTTVKRVLCSAGACVFAVCVHAAEFESLFNGRDLSGWAGKEGLWSVYSIDREGMPVYFGYLEKAVEAALEGNEIAIRDRERLKKAKRVGPGCA